MNDMSIDFVKTEMMSESQQTALNALRSAVYPPAVLATLPGTQFMWAAPQWSVLLWDEGELVSRVGVVVRDIMSNDKPKRIGGIGGVMTHPERRGQGLASQT